ncbi:HNH endonuclease [Paracoccus sulfuroxidans]|uniref:Putative HNH nuclease YajD n=1 Tax=Paracoccus sulfuroxidans TaxID=384678 RepID=A0A562NC34_9RHOB|nr:HNH endonuclease signature motif containing protein [Paracoccus sulfuroxidans]TWI29726.1 HNH endonuclease [Paracoccus sulfuroxidans]
MARLKQLTPRVGALQQRMPQPHGQSRVRDQVYAWRKWYKLQRWRDLRWQVLVDAMFTCARCQRVGAGPDLVADHKEPHRGDADLFWDRRNLQCLCKPCHDGEKQREERARS